MKLAINTASLKTSIALLEKTKVLAEKSWPSKSDEAEKLMPEIFVLLKRRNATFSDIKEIYVIKGPGSFTGLRIGITVANTIAYLNRGGGPSDCQLFAISTFEYWRSLSSLPILIYAGSGGVYLYQNSIIQLINLKDLNKVLRAKKIKEVFGDITLEQKSILRGIKFKKNNQSFGKIMAKIIQQSSQLRPVKIVEPLYIKQPAISISKKLICST